MEALRQLKAAEPPSFLSPSQELSQKARAASQHLFSALKPYSSTCELPELVTDGFDAEQIWAQIEAQSEELVRLVKTQLRKLEKNPQELEKQFSFGGQKREEEEVEGLEESDDDDVAEEEEEEEGSEEEEEEEGSEEEEGEEEEGDGLRDVEDEFFKIKDLERFVEGEEEREFGNMGEGKGKGKGKGKKGEEKKRKRRAVEEDEDSEDGEEEEDEDEDEDDDEDEHEVWNLVSFELITLPD